MQAVIYEQFGDTSVLSLKEVATPRPERGEVQVRVNVASLNPVDFKLRHGVLRLVGRPLRPAITGKDFAGVITALGTGVEDYSLGQRVFGSVNPMNGRGSCAQFVVLSTDLIAPTPYELSDEVAACLPVAAGTALQSLTDIAHLKQEQSILITGASGAVGSAAVQIASQLGAHITGVCGPANIDYVLGMGAERAIDYKKESWLNLDRQFDVIFDAAAAESFASARPRLKSTGMYINTMPGAKLFVSAMKARLFSRQRCVPFLLKTDSELLRRLARLAADQTVVPHIQETIGLAQVASAQLQMEQGQVHGKICVRVVT